MFVRQSNVIHIANRIISGDRYKTAALVAQIPIIKEIDSSNWCNASALHSAAIIRLRLAEEALNSGDQHAIGENQQLLIN